MVAAAAAPPLVEGDLGRRLDRFLTDSGYSGAALVARRGQILLCKGYGLADRERGIPFGPDTVFPIGSITKQFTAAAILRLEMEGKLHVEDPIGRFFEDVPEDKRAITLHHLLTHTAGLESDFARDDEEVGRDAYVRRILGSRLRSRPGDSYFYANSGYSLLGAIVEKTSGEPYETYLQQHLLRPAGMTETGYRAPRWEPARLARGYRGDRPWGTIFERNWAPDGPHWALRGNGGIHSTLGDLYRWHLALEGSSVLSEEARGKAFTTHVAEGPAGESHYGYGWSIGRAPWGGRLIAHDGGNGIFSADFRRYVDDGLVVITASNVSESKAFEVSSSLARIAMGEAVVARGPRTRALTPLGDAGRHGRIRAYVEAFNTGDAARMRAFRAEHMSATPAHRMTDEERDAMFRRMVEDLGRIEVKGILVSSEDGVRVLVQSAAGDLLEMEFLFDPGIEGRIAGLVVTRGEAPE
jgi:CubicO group peptidase (beta-lactamase class C family)